MAVAAIHHMCIELGSAYTVGAGRASSCYRPRRCNQGTLVAARTLHLILKCQSGQNGAYLRTERVRPSTFDLCKNARGAGRAIYKDVDAPDGGPGDKIKSHRTL